MQQFSAADFSTDKQSGSGEPDMADDREHGDEEEMKKSKTEGSSLRRIEEMAENIRSTLSYKRTEVLSTEALAEQSKN